MCQECLKSLYQGSGWNGFWTTEFMVPLEDFEKCEKYYRDILKEAKLKVRRRLYFRDILVKPMDVELFDFTDNNSCLLVFNSHKFVAQIKSSLILRRRRFWCHELWGGLYLFSASEKGYDIVDSSTLRDLDEKLRWVYFNQRR